MTVDDTGSNSDGICRKDTWDSLPSEIKEKIVKYVPLATRITIKRVSKQYLDIVTNLNDKQTKLVVIGQYEFFEDEIGVNMVCNIASHSLDHTSVIRFRSSQDGKILVRNFPNIVAVYFSRCLGKVAADVSPSFRNLRHLSCLSFGNSFTGFEKLHGMELSCLHDYSRIYNYSTVKLPVMNLKHFAGKVESSEAFEEMLRRGLVGVSLENRKADWNLMKHYAVNIEILNDVGYNEQDSPSVP